MKRNPADFFVLGVVLIIAAGQLYLIARSKKRAKTFGLLPFWVHYAFWVICVILPMVGIALLALNRSR
jgi:hypothetical protein